MKNPNFIGSYNNVLSEIECNQIIDYFESDPNKEPGVVSKRTDKGIIESLILSNIKKSTDRTYNVNEDHFTPYLISERLQNYANEYVKEFPSVDRVSRWSMCPSFNIQRYDPGEAYYEYHCEHFSPLIDRVINARLLAWMIYLNTVTDDGGTEFLEYDLVTNAELGKLLIWPAYFTHVHRGIPSRTQTKYIATGWFAYLIPPELSGDLK